jgi:multidrug resistance efflux pump
MLFFVSWFVKYPDIIKTEIVITTNIPPEKLVAKTSGRIEAILVKDNETIAANTTLAVIANAADYKAVFLLKSIVDKINVSEIKNGFSFDTLNNARLGEIENAYAVFQKDCLAYTLNDNLQPFRVDEVAHNSENAQIRERINLLRQQQTISESELVLQKNDLGRYETLLNQGVISAQEYEQKKMGYLQAEKNYKVLLSSISQLQSSLIDNTRSSKSTVISSTKEDSNLGRNIIQSFYLLKKAIKDWELLYTLQSSIAGKVSFLQIWSESQTINAGDNVFSVIPSGESGYIGKVKAPALNSGKIRKGQLVNIRLSNFPDREFGVLKGAVKNISLVPDKDGNLLLDVVLPEGLKTSYKKQIPFQQEMRGSAEIVAEDLRLIQRLFYQFKNIF